jgi:hypothetical protein
VVIRTHSCWPSRVGWREPSSAARAATITLAVTPEDASLLIFSQEQGRVWLTLLPPNQPGVDLPAANQGSLQR